MTFTAIVRTEYVNQVFRSLDNLYVPVRHCLERVPSNQVINDNPSVLQYLRSQSSPNYV